MSELPILKLQPPTTYRIGNIGHGKIVMNTNNYLCLEVIKDVVPSDIHIEDVRYIAISEKALTEIEINNINLEYKKYIINSKSFTGTNYGAGYGAGMREAGYRNYWESTNEIIFFNSIEFYINIVYPKCTLFTTYSNFLELVRKDGKVYTERPVLYSTNTLSRYEYDIPKQLEKIRNASIDGLVQRKHHSLLHNLYVYYINEAEAASIYIDFKNKIAKQKEDKIKKKAKKIEKGISPFSIISNINYCIGKIIGIKLREKYPIWKKYSLGTIQTKQNAHYFLELAKDLNVEIKTSFKTLLPYVPGILKAKEKNDYYKFVKLAIKMKLIEKPKEL